MKHISGFKDTYRKDVNSVITPTFSKLPSKRQDISFDRTDLHNIRLNWNALVKLLNLLIQTS